MIKKLRELADNRSRKEWTHSAFLQFVSKQDREFFIALSNYADEILELIETCERFRNDEGFEVIDYKLQKLCEAGE